jgi:hypothetical protein
MNTLSKPNPLPKTLQTVSGSHRQRLRRGAAISAIRLAYVKIGRLVRYRAGDVDAFEIARLHEVVANDN